MNLLQLTVFADYFQIYLNDYSAIESYMPEWSNEDYQTMLHADTNGIVISTVRNMDVEVNIKIEESGPQIDFSKWDHVVESGLELSTGELVIRGATELTESAFRIRLNPGGYRFLFCYSGLGTLSEDGLEGDDKYSVFIWRGDAHLKKTVLKQWPGTIITGG